MRTMIARPCRKASSAFVLSRHPEIRLTLEWAAHIVRPVPAAVLELDNRQNEIFRLVERIENLVLGHGYRVGSRTAPVCTENSDSDVLVVQPTDKRMRRNVSGALNRSGYRGIFVQGTMGPRLIVIASV